jgi:hypothetical protein
MKKTGLKVLSTACIILIVLSACSPQTTAPPAEPTSTAAVSPEPIATEPPQPQGQPFTSERFGYTFQYPANWIVKDRPGEWAEFDPLDPNRTGGIDAFGGYVNNRNLTIGFGARELSGEETLESWVETAKTLIKDGVSRGVCYEDIENDPVSEEDMTLDGEAALMLEYVCPGARDSFGLVVLSIHDNKGYWITWIAPQGNAEGDKAEFTQILSTFSFVD